MLAELAENAAALRTDALHAGARVDTGAACPNQQLSYVSGATALRTIQARVPEAAGGRVRASVVVEERAGSTARQIASNQRVPVAGVAGSCEHRVEANVRAIDLSSALRHKTHSNAPKTLPIAAVE